MTWDREWRDPVRRNEGHKNTNARHAVVNPNNKSLHDDDAVTAACK